MLLLLATVSFPVPDSPKSQPPYKLIGGPGGPISLLKLRYVLTNSSTAAKLGWLLSLSPTKNTC